MTDQVDWTLMERRLRLDIARQMEEMLTRQALDHLIPKELLTQIKTWAKANDCLLREAIACLIERGLEAEHGKNTCGDGSPRPRGRRPSP